MVSSKDLYQISSEYNAIDIPKSISSFATDKFRSITNSTTVRISKLDKLVGFYTGKLTNVGELLNIVDSIFRTSFNFIKYVVKTIRNLSNSESTNEEEHEDKPANHTNTDKELSKEFLSYYTFFHNVKKIKWDTPESYLNVNKVTHIIITKLKESSLENKWREATPEEIHNLKMFKPERITAEMENGLRIMKEEASKLDNLDKWEPIYNQAMKDAKDLMEFILNNISDTDRHVEHKLV